MTKLNALTKNIDLLNQLRKSEIQIMNNKVIRVNASMNAKEIDEILMS